VLSNIVSGGPSIIRKPGAYRSNLELTNSLRSNFLAAQQDYAAAQANGNGNSNGNSNGDGNGAPRTSFDGSRPPMSAWTERADGGKTLFVPRIDWAAAGLQEEPSQYDTTVKLFFLPTAPAAAREQYAREALDLVLRELGVLMVDLLIVSFPGMSFDGDCEWEADKMNAAMGDDAEETATWRVVEGLHARGIVKNLGIAEFGSEKLARFLKRVTVPPSVDQINIKNCCNVPPPLAELAKQRDIELLVHSDCTDILPKGTLRDLLGQGIQGAGILADNQVDGETGLVGLQGDLIPQWVVKYTAVVRDRGVIENKGYFAGAELAEC
jgi:glutamate--cysteine ligase regulatory subunit